MAANWNIKPYHGFAKTLGTDSNTTSFTFFYTGNEKAYQDAQPLNSTSTTVAFKKSGYQYITTIINTASGAASEGQGVIETVSRTITRQVNEFIGNTEIGDLRPPRESENSGIQETVIRKVIKSANEFIGSKETAAFSGVKQDPENAGIAETVIRIVTKYADEFIGSSESAFPVVLEDHIFSTAIQGQQGENPIFSTVLQSSTIEYGTFSTQITGMLYNLAAVTATGGTSQYPVSGGIPIPYPNPFNPSVVLGGITYVGSAPSGANSLTAYIDIPNSLIPNNKWTDCFGAGMSLDNSGGSFDISCVNYPGTIGNNINLFGLNSTITRGSDGPDKINVLSNSVKGYRIGGIFGSPKLNKQLNLTVAGSLITTPIVLNSNFIAAGNTAGMTARSISTVIANACGIDLTWAVTDVPVINFSLETGMNGLSALQSLAARAHGVLRWNGNNSYIIAYPDVSIGLYQPFSPLLIAGGGLEYDNLLDMETGLGGAVRPNSPIAPFQGVVTLPVYTVANQSVTQGALNLTPTTTQIAKVTKQLTSDDPPLVFDLPFDYDKVYIQILVSPTGSTGGNNLIDINNYVTRDPQQWSEFNIATVGSSYIFQTQLGNAFIPQVKIDYKVFPQSNDSIDNGNFVLSLACTRKSLPSLNTNPNTQTNLQFVRVYQGTFTNVFYGVLPLPGMYGKAVVDGMVVQGIIETVTYNPPGFVTVNVAQYRRLNYTVPYNQIGPLTS